MAKKHVLVLGADGYLGWPACMFLSARGHRVTAVDNYFKRRIVDACGVTPLNRCPRLGERTAAWQRASARSIDVIVCDLTEPAALERIFAGSAAYDAVIHFAEQPSAPYSMMDPRASHETLLNNIGITHNLLQAIRCVSPQTHLIKLGTMGEYGTPDIDIEEGWLDIQHKGRNDRFLFPRQGGSIYHTSKIMDTDLIWFAVRNWQLRATDLMQGPVYGFFTDEMAGIPELATAVHYDEIFGTVLNRFVVEAVIGHPLTVYGLGDQMRGFINLRDSLRCLELALDNPPSMGQLAIYNQVTETFSVNELARSIQKAAKSAGLEVSIEHVDNPRIENEAHYYNPTYQSLRNLGLEPHLLTTAVLEEMLAFVSVHRMNVNEADFVKHVRW